MIFRLMLEIGLRRSLFPILNVTDVVNAAVAIGRRFCWKFALIVERANEGSDIMSPRDISLAPVMVRACSGRDPMPTEVIFMPRSVSPVIRPIGDVPATPSVSIVA